MATKAFPEAVCAGYPAPTGEFVDVPFIKAFLVAARGHADELATHYPRITREPTSAGENFKWFVGNENSRYGKRLSLPSLGSDPGLPLKPTI
jgi:hypothetical protein